MVTITCMLVVANVQSSVGEMIPKTSYFKMIDYFLLYSLNIIILVMVYHTYMTAHILEDFAPNADDIEIEKVLKFSNRSVKFQFIRSNLLLKREFTVVLKIRRAQSSQNSFLKVKQDLQIHNLSNIFRRWTSG